MTFQVESSMDKVALHGNAHQFSGVISGMLTVNHEEMVWKDGREKPMWLSFGKGNETRAGLCKPAVSRAGIEGAAV